MNDLAPNVLRRAATIAARQAGVAAPVIAHRIAPYSWGAAVDAWNRLGPNQKRERVAKCQTHGHAWQDVPGLGDGVRMCRRCCRWWDR